MRTLQLVPGCAGLLCAALLGLLCDPVLAADGDPIIDKEYCFRLDAPGDGWRLMDEKSMQRVVPDAQAGMVGPNGVWAAVIAEEAPAPDLAGFAKMLLENLPIENRVVESQGKTTFKGRPAMQFRVSGRVRDIEIVYVNTMFSNGKYMFQLLAWGPRALARAGFHEPVHKAFRILPGEVTGRTRDTRVPDSTGIGWRVKDGKFESAAFGLALEPRGGWRLAVGGELQQMNPDAEIGLVHSKPDAYLVMIVESAAGMEHAAFRKLVMDAWGEGEVPRRTARTLKADVGGKPLVLEGYEFAEHKQLKFLKGVVFHGDLCVQILTWHITGAAKEVDPIVTDALDSIRFLDGKQVDDLTTELERGPDPENTIGEEHALRRGLYRNFQYDFSLEKPRGQFWRFRTGQDARAENPDATLLMDHPGLGLMGTVIAEEFPDGTLDEYHDFVAKALFGDDHEAVRKGPDKVRISGGDAYRTQGVLEESGLQMEYSLHTAVRNGFAYQFLVYGLSPNVRAAKTAIAALIRGVELHERLEQQETRGGTFTDVRLGFSMGLRAPWRRIDMTPPALMALASLQAWRRSSSDMVLLIAICALQPAQDATWFREFVGRIAADRFKDILRSKPTPSKSTLAGQACERLTWKEGDNTNELFLLMRDRTFYGLFVMRKGGYPAGEIELVRESFRLVR